jgi:hypothetical protein
MELRVKSWFTSLEISNTKMDGWMVRSEKRQKLGNLISPTHFLKHHEIEQKTQQGINSTRKYSCKRKCLAIMILGSLTPKNAHSRCSYLILSLCPV